MSDAPTGWVELSGALERKFTFEEFAAALAFVNRVGAAAEADDHPLTPRTGGADERAALDGRRRRRNLLDAAQAEVQERPGDCEERGQDRPDDDVSQEALEPVRERCQ